MVSVARPSSVVRPKKVYFTMVDHPLKGWIRVGNAYLSREAASEWLPFVRGAWRGCKVRVSQLTLHWVGDQMSERSRRALDEKFNMDLPKGQGARP